MLLVLPFLQVRLCKYLFTLPFLMFNMNIFFILCHYGFIFGAIFCFVPFYQVNAIRKYSKEDLLKLREEVRQMFDHAYTGYLKYAYPYDELRPLTCDGIDTWGSYSLTLIDALDTLAVMGNFSEFRRVVDIVTTKANFDANINVSVFETNIRIVGGLLSAHLLSQRAGIDLEPGWPCNGPLLRLAEDVARRLLAAFDTPSGMPYGTVNLRHGVPPGETTVTCTAGVGTFILEFATLSRLTGDPVYEEVALNALYSLFERRSGIGLFGNHIDVSSGRWVALDSGIGAGVDSFFEYLVKGAILLDRPELMAMFKEVRKPVDRYLKKNHWYVWASMHKGQVTLPVFQSLEAYWPGVLSLIGDIDTALRSMHNYNRVWKQYGFTPEFYNIAQGEAGSNRESYPLRPELAESAMYLYRATGDTFMLDIGLNILRSLQHSAKTPCGYATIKDARDHTQENRMESFFLAETTKYLYLLFDPENFIHNDGSSGKVHVLPSGRQCVLDAGGYIFNTEAHPIDPAALRCCYEWKEEKDFWKKSKNSKGDILSSRKKEKKVAAKKNTSERYDDNETSKLIVQGADENFQNQTNDQFKISGEENSNDVKSSLSEEVQKLSRHTDTLHHLLNIVKASHESVSIKRGNENDKGSEDGPTFSQNSSESPVLEWPPNSTLSEPSTSENEESLRDYVRELVGFKSLKKQFDPQQLLESIRVLPVDTSLGSSTKYQLLTCPAQPFHIRLTIAGEFIEEK